MSLIIKRNGTYLKKFFSYLNKSIIGQSIIWNNKHRHSTFWNYSSSFFERISPIFSNALFNGKSTTSREIVRSVERRVSSSSAKLLSMTKRDTVKSLYVAFLSARACSRRSTGEARSFLQFFSPPFSTQPRFTMENDGSVRQRQRRMQKWHGTTELCTGRVIFTGRKWSNGGNESSSSPLHPSSSIFSLLCIHPWLDGWRFKATYIFSRRQAH